MKSLISRRTELEANSGREAGWVYEETDKTYGEVWHDSTPEERRNLLVDAGVKLYVYNKYRLEVFVPEDILERVKNR